MLDFSNITKQFITPSPKEKAQELVYYYLNILGDEFDKNDHWYFYGDRAKQCAVTAVNEILKVVNPFKVSYWKKVKEEILKL